MKTLALFTPYELVAGGGTRYVFGVAEALRDRCDVYLVTPEEQPISSIAMTARNIGVSADHVVPISWERAHARRAFNYSVVFGNEALPPVPGLGERNFFVCQFPFPMQQEDLALRKVYHSQYESIVVYSAYVEYYLLARLKELQVETKPLHIINPAADRVPSDRWFVRRSHNSIVSVGRFFDIGHSKRQDELIDLFRGLNNAGWTLHLAGAIRFGGPHQAAYDECVRRANGLAVKFYPNAPRSLIGRLYRQSTCYWHGAGLGADPETEPEKFEHFGISVVEAMAAGCLPLVYAYGGPAEIVTSGHDGWVYKTPGELIEHTSQLRAAGRVTKIRAMREQARISARAYTSAAFQAKWRHLLSM
jgi:glycosyltransferase involved in cell wall biosynthesis